MYKELVPTVSFDLFFLIIICLTLPKAMKTSFFGHGSPSVIIISIHVYQLIYNYYNTYLHQQKLIPQSWVYSELFRMVEREKMPRLVPKFYQGKVKKFKVNET